MKFLRKIACIFLCILTVGGLTVPAAASEQADRIRQDLISYYFHYREEAAREIGNQLQILTDLDPEMGQTWMALMEQWAWINEEMPVHTGILPEGLPEDDSLCIVVLGYGLNRDGSMKQELLDRLEVALNSAENYPEAYVLCTGGETSDAPGISEAGQMGSWLLAKGLEHNRLILETASLSTTENARNSCRLLRREYPQVRSVAIVSSDYHIRWGSACFMAMELLQGGGKGLELAGNAGCVTASPDRDTMYSQAWGISILAGVPFDSERVPPLYMTEQPVPVQTEAAAAAAEAPAEEAPEGKAPVVPVLLGLAAVLLILFVPKKRKKSGSV